MGKTKWDKESLVAAGVAWTTENKRLPSVRDNVVSDKTAARHFGSYANWKAAVAKALDGNTFINCTFTGTQDNAVHILPDTPKPTPVLPPITIHAPKVKTREHLFIPDTQHILGLPVNHLTAIGNYAAERRPDVIVFAGDVADFRSLSSYETAAKKGRMICSVEDDFRAWHEAIDAVMKPICNAKGYGPEVHVLLGNHDGFGGARRGRYADTFPEFANTVSDERIIRDDVEVHPFLQPVMIDGISYCHFFCVDSNGRVMQSRKGQASAKAQVNNVGTSSTAGHKQGLDVAVKECASGRRRAAICGSYYQHDEDYLTPQGNSHWRGCLYKHEVHDGDYDLMELSIHYLLSKWT